jgi:hypothetical protein
MRIQDPGWRQFGSEMGKCRIRDKHPGSATLEKIHVFVRGFTHTGIQTYPNLTSSHNLYSTANVKFNNPLQRIS